MSLSAISLGFMFDVAPLADGVFTPNAQLTVGTIDRSKAIQFGLGCCPCRGVGFELRRFDGPRTHRHYTMAHVHA